jgi:hypothetical protein
MESASWRVKLQGSARPFLRRSAPLEAAVAAPEAPEGGRRSIGYLCGADDDGSAERIADYCAARGLRLLAVRRDADEAQRTALVAALEELAFERAESLVVARLHDLSASTADMAPLLRWFAGERHTLVAMDLELDTATEAGRVAALALADCYAGGGTARRASTPKAVADIPELQERIARMRHSGMTLQAIADTLNDENVPTLRGGVKWRPSSVQRATGYRRPRSGGRGIQPRV